jgi:hypothetical protein
MATCRSRRGPTPENGKRMDNSGKALGLSDLLDKTLRVKLIRNVNGLFNLKDDSWCRTTGKVKISCRALTLAIGSLGSIDPPAAIAAPARPARRKYRSLGSWRLSLVAIVLAAMSELRLPSASSNIVVPSSTSSNIALCTRRVAKQKLINPGEWPRSQSRVVLRVHYPCRNTACVLMTKVDLSIRRSNGSRPHHSCLQSRCSPYRDRASVRS